MALHHSSVTKDRNCCLLVKSPTNAGFVEGIPPVVLETGTWEQRGKGISSCVHGWAGRDSNPLLSWARQCPGVSLLLLSQIIGSDPKLGALERKMSPGGCSGLVVKGFEQNADFPEQLKGSVLQPAQLKPELRNSLKKPKKIKNQALMG